MKVRSYTSSRSSSSGRPVRPMDWECAQLATNALPTDGISCAWVVLPSVMRGRYTDPTLMASRWWLDGTVAAQGAAGGFLGVGLIAWDSPTDATPALCPDPLDQCDLDWITRHVWPRAATQGAALLNGVTFDLDHLSKAKRRLGNQSSILYVASSTGAGAATFAADIRVLIKE